MGAARGAAHSPRGLNHDGGWVAPFHLNGLRAVDRRRNISRTLCDSAVIAMAVDLCNRFAGDFQSDCTAAALHFNCFQRRILRQVGRGLRLTANMNGALLFVGERRSIEGSSSEPLGGPARIWSVASAEVYRYPTRYQACSSPANCAKSSATRSNSPSVNAGSEPFGPSSFGRFT